MKRIISLFITCFAVTAAFAQKADIEVSYEYKTTSSKGNVKSSIYHLLANAQQSKYFSPKSEQIDSLTSTPDGAAKYKETQEAALKAMIAQGSIDVKKLPRKTENIYVLKSLPDSTITYYDIMGADENVYYTEPMSEMIWNIGDETKNILGYDCINATSDYHGRKWTAWFTPEIPISDGPWKFHGLPGLILEAEEASGTYSFIANGIEKSNKTIIPVYGSDKYDKTDHITILRAERATIDNPMGTLAAKGVKAKINPSSLPKSDRTEWDFIETDY